MLTCRVMGHRFAFRAEGPTMVWECERGCGAGGSKEYPTQMQAQRYAVAFDHRATDEIGRRAPVLGLFPLRLWRWMRDRWS